MRKLTFGYKFHQEQKKNQPSALKQSAIGLLLIAAITGGTWGHGQERDNQALDQSPLKGVLEMAADYADKVKQVALYFFCTETIEDTSFTYKCQLSSDFLGIPLPSEIMAQKSQTKRHEYDYQMVHNDKELYEQRHPIGQSDLQPGDLTIRLTDSMRLKYTIYGAVGFLSRYWQNHFSFRLIGQEVMNGRKAWIIAAEPAKDNRENYMRGKIWIDAADGSVHRIEFVPLNPAAYPAFFLLPTSGFARQILGTILFDRVKNGIRFPTQENLSDAYVRFDGSVFPVHSAQILFQDYRFFIVSTQVEEKQEEGGSGG